MELLPDEGTELRGPPGSRWSVGSERRPDGPEWLQSNKVRRLGRQAYRIYHSRDFLIMVSKNNRWMTLFSVLDWIDHLTGTVPGLASMAR